MICFACQQEIELGHKVSFRSMCPQCKVALHVCVNCKFYTIGKPNDCSIPNTERVLDRKKANFCEEFFLRAPSKPSLSEDPLVRAIRILGEPLQKKKNPFQEDL